MEVSLGRHDIGNALTTEVNHPLLKQLFRFLRCSYAEVASPKLLEQDHAASFGSFLRQCYLPNGVAAKGKCNDVMLGVNVAQTYHSDRALNLKWLQYL